MIWYVVDNKDNVDTRCRFLVIKHFLLIYFNLKNVYIFKIWHSNHFSINSVISYRGSLFQVLA